MDNALQIHGIDNDNLREIVIETTQQQYLHIEGLDSTDARALLMKVITALITVVHVLFFVVGTIINIVKPFMRTSSRILATSILVVFLAIIYYQQDNVVAVFHKFKQRTIIPTANAATS